MCSERDCMYVCTVGILCFYRHLKAFHDGRKDTPYSAVPVDILDGQSVEEHTGHCLFLSKLHLDKLNKKKEEIRIAKRLALVQARQDRRKANLEVRLIQKAMSKNYKRNENKKKRKNRI